MRRIVTGRRLAIRVDADTLLSVPPIPPGTSREDRVRILEYVLRRQVGLADTYAHLLDEVKHQREAMLDVPTAALIAERPNGVARAA